MLPHYHGVVLLHAGVVLHDGDKAYFRFHNSSRPLNDPRISIDVVSIVGKNGLQNCQGKKNLFFIIYWHLKKYFLTHFEKIVPIEIYFTYIYSDRNMFFNLETKLTQIIVKSS